MGRLFYRRDCGHLDIDAVLPGTDETRPLRGKCYDCRSSRIGTEITFVRYGHAPESGRSWDYRDNSPLKGVSVYEIVQGKRVDAGWIEGITDRGTVIRGRAILVGWGPDGEPLVDWSTVRPLRSRKVK